MVWDPARITPQPWPSVSAFYRYIEDRNKDFGPLLRLVDHVASRPYAASIAAATSGTALLVAPLGETDWVRRALRVDVDLGGSIRFTLPSATDARPASFECEGDIVVAFEARLRKWGWLVGSE